MTISIVCAGAADRAENRQHDLVGLEVGPVGDAAAERLAALARGAGTRSASSRRSPVANSQSKAKVSASWPTTGPSTRKCRSLNRMAIVGLAQMAVANVHAAGEAERAIDDQDLAVVAKVRVVQPAGNAASAGT